MSEMQTPEATIGTEPNTQAPEAVPEVDTVSGEWSGGKGDRRSFTVMSNDHKIANGGTYISSTPLGAAKKAARQLFAKSSRSRKIHFVLREMTRGSAKKTYKYVATKKKLDKPVEVVRGGVKVVVKFEYDIKADA